MAKGEYFSFIDDDDLVSEEYVDQVLRKLRKNPDVVTFWGVSFSQRQEGQASKLRC